MYQEPYLQYIHSRDRNSSIFAAYCEADCMFLAVDLQVTEPNQKLTRNPELMLPNELMLPQDMAPSVPLQRHDNMGKVG